MQQNRLREIWQSGQAAYNAWLAIPSAWTAELVAHSGYDAVTIDMQHGLADYQTALSMLQAIASSGAVPLARVPWNDPAIIMRMLDAGAQGLICPMTNNRRDTEAFAGACRYPPLGYRSYGPIRANMQAGREYFAAANQQILALAMIETAEALKNLDEILSTPGIDGVYVGTVDLSISLGLPRHGDMDDPTLQEAVKRILAGVHKYGLVAGMHSASPQQGAMLVEWGFRLITPINDSNLLRAAAKSALDAARRGK